MDANEVLRDIAIAKLVECQKNRDVEVAHGNADDVLCDLLTDLGYGAVVAEWDKVRKWYA
jgi:hypothetical protein